jgi:outer membrane protein assembly factor BamB
LAWTWLFREVPRQTKWISTAAFLMAAYAGFLIWVVFVSGWKSRARWSVIGLTIAVILFCRFALRISGVTGDLVPIVEWRWKDRSSVAQKGESALGFTSAEAKTSLASGLTNSYPQFLGPHRNGILDGPQLARDWKQLPPRQLWKHAVGSAWSGFAVSGGRAVTQEQHGPDELVACYNVITGAQLWSHTNQSRYATTIAGEGPRATPTIWSNRVYTMGGAGMLNCLELESGRVLWHTNTIAAHGAKVPEWGVACSPLVTDRAVFVTVGGRNSSMVAYDKNTGTVLWQSGNDDVHWSSPIRVTLDGVPQILIFSESVSSYDEGSGKVLWQYPWRSAYPHVSVPLLLSSNRVLVSQGYGTGSELLQISREGSRWRASRIWKSIRMKSKFGALIHLDGFVYGLDDGALACIDANTGELKWKGDRYGHGQMMLVGDLLLLMAESGDVVLLEPNPNEQRELARFKVFSDKTWNPPALAGDLLLVRNDREAACLRLPLRTAK